MSAGNRLCGYVQSTDNGTRLSEGVLLAHCNALLQAAAMPSRILILERLPRGVAGKVVRSALPAPDWGAPLAGASLRGFWTPYNHSGIEVALKGGKCTEGKHEAQDLIIGHYCYWLLLLLLLILLLIIIVMLCLDAGEWFRSIASASGCMACVCRAKAVGWRSHWCIIWAQCCG